MTDNTNTAVDNEVIVLTPKQIAEAQALKDAAKAEAKEAKLAAKAVKAEEAQLARDAKAAASVVAKAEVKARKAAEKLELASIVASAIVKRIPKTAEEKRLAINAATALRRSTPEGKAYAAAAAAKSYAKKTAAIKLVKQELAEAASLEDMFNADPVGGAS